MTAPKHTHGPRNPRRLTILHEDRDVLVIDKPHGLLTMGTDTEKENTAYWKMTDYVRRGSPKSDARIFIVHRLDRDVSGVLLFAKTVEAKMFLQENWEQAEKTYLAVVKGVMPEKEGIITSHLVEENNRFVHSTRDTTRGKLSRTAYRVVREYGSLSLLEVSLLTGRKNQIRVHLAEQGHAIVGDAKYGVVDKTNRRLALHAVSLSFTHPTTGKRMVVESRVPEYFNRLTARPVAAAETAPGEGGRTPAVQKAQPPARPKKGEGPARGQGPPRIRTKDWLRKNR